MHTRVKWYAPAFVQKILFFVLFITNNGCGEVESHIHHKNENGSGGMDVFYNIHPRILEICLKIGDKMWSNGCEGKMGLSTPE